ncbi:hypothetical protein Pla144_23640 [Bythopirellula polymerisocia]|uniref:Uncharacterized protein n=1 Tax=Bythopirellula polymerisocia TaxID=2528003 RepID=A0A5C6CVR0_9BACT|nr:hypothetical protein Pla144_23640 [Bythopirellula polymerisocia]
MFATVVLVFDGSYDKAAENVLAATYLNSISVVKRKEMKTITSNPAVMLQPKILHVMTIL